MASEPLQTYKGAQLKFVVEYKDCNGVALDLTGYTFTMQVRANVSSPNVLVNLTMGNGLSLTEDPGTLLVVIPSSATVSAPASAVFDIKPVDTMGETDPSLIIGGSINFIPMVTRSQ